jgi:pantothenate kinase
VIRSPANGHNGLIEHLTLDQLVDRVVTHAARPGTSVVGITGPPGAGKTTVAEAVVAAAAAQLGKTAVAHVPMDGFHLADVELRRLGRLSRKGAPDTCGAGCRRSTNPTPGWLPRPHLVRPASSASTQTPETR